MNRLIFSGIHVCFLCLLLLLGYVGFCLWWFNYQEFIGLVKNRYERVYQMHELDWHYFTLNRFYLSRLVISASLAVTISGWLFYIKNPDKISAFISDFLLQVTLLFKNTFQLFFHLYAWQKALLIFCFISILGFRVIYANQLFFHVDEVFSYISFVKEGPLLTMSYYPEPNNHILFNLLCGFFSLFVEDPVWIMRLPSLLANLVLLFILAAFMYTCFGLETALVSLVMSAFLLPSSIYAVQGRGYMLMSLCALLATFAIFQYVQQKKPVYLLLFMAASMAGAYTIPVFLFVLMPLLVFGVHTSFLTKDKALRKNLVVAACFIGSGVFLLYLPVCLFSGAENLLGNRWVQRMAPSNFLQIFVVASAESVEYVMGVSKGGYWWLSLWAIPFFYILSTKKSMLLLHRRWFRLIITFLVTTLCLILFLRVFPPYRTWTYFTFLYASTLSILLVWGISSLFRREITRKILTGITCFSIVCVGMVQHSRYLKSPSFIRQQRFYTVLLSQAEYILAKKPARIFIPKPEGYLYYYLNYKIPENYPDLQFNFGVPDPRVSYDFLINHDPNVRGERTPAAHTYRLLFRDEESTVYERIK